MYISRLISFLTNFCRTWIVVPEILNHYQATKPPPKNGECVLLCSQAGCREEGEGSVGLPGTF